MKALVVSNCATSGYVRSLRVLFPEWNVAGATEDTVQNWVQDTSGETYERFSGFASHADVILGTDRNELWSSLPLKRQAVKITVPAFGFKGLHPDAFHLAGMHSILGGGNLFSRIAVTGYFLGKSVGETIGYFRGESYEKLGYLDVYSSERERVVAKFARSGIDISDDFSTWEARGKFVYTYNHPKIFVLFAILLRALQGRVVSGPDLRRLAEKAGEVEDDLAAAIVWPVYTEVGERLGIREPLVWRKGKRHDYETLDLSGFVTRTFERLAQSDVRDRDAVPGFDRCAEVLGPGG